MTTHDPRILDGHNDTLLDLHVDERGGGRSFFERSERGHVDLPRAREAGYGGGLFAIFVPNEAGSPDPQRTDDGYEIPLASAVDHERAKRFTYAVLERVYRIAADSDGEVQIARCVDDVAACLDDGGLAVIPHLEGAAAVAPDLSNLDFLHAAGVRSIGLTWSRPNEFAHGVPFRYPASPDTGPGLTDAGRALVDACNDRGIVLDLAHLNAAGFFEVAERSTDPLVVSHTGVHAICPSTRNLTDEQIETVADSGGVIGVSLMVENLRPDGEYDRDTPVELVVDHVAHVVDRVGIDHVALGTDFDGATIPEPIGDVTGLPKVVAALGDRGFEGEDLQAILRDNWLRVLDDTWE